VLGIYQITFHPASNPGGAAKCKEWEDAWGQAEPGWNLKELEKANPPMPFSGIW
jgi:hypothetical protein